jgi:hypothetical protein
MPPITLAFVRKNHRDQTTARGFQDFVNQNISDAFVLDGIQRLSTLKRAYEENGPQLKLDQPLFVNVLLCSSMDNLLYRMITLNNGQRPMTTRHQIEILSANWFEVTDGNIALTTEREGSYRTQGVFAQADFVLAYMAFMSNSINVDSQKLIQEKLDDLIAARILEHEPSSNDVGFDKVTSLIGRLCDEPLLDRWFKVLNNLIGFCAGIRDGFKTVSDLSSEDFADYVARVEEALSSYDVSKIKLGRTRRDVVAYCIRHADELHEGDADFITEQLLPVVEP